ncbi:MAG: tRNA uridine-5-carboxymethylaminomethyl(34) synthesis GTPase MnmE [Clostridia bacterium]|nr:tRNA uridine-5-carboxymethylaminomethyl(34) synthesis GTPase MnmE [Clostridia bacterium]
MKENTIAAIATAPGVGGIGIIRVSGEEAFSVVAKIFRPKDASFNLLAPKANIMKYGYIMDGETKIDEVMVSFFRAPHSYTTENVAEINCHGGIVILNRILSKVIEAGARIAEPGEFTKRAFLNGRIDLAQAESIIDLITSKTDLARQIAAKQLDGFLSSKLKEIKTDIYDVLIQIEAGIDYPEHEIEEVTREKLQSVLENAKNSLAQMYASFEQGRIIKEGVRTVILGKPNVGKSSLMNTLLKEERAIVTDIPGTTRDTIEEVVNLRGIPLRIVDTAGIRETTDKIEEIGVNKAKSEIAQADMIIAVFDISRDLTEEDYEIIELIKDKKSIVIVNKVDLEEQWNPKEIFKNQKILNLSAKNKIGLEDLEEEIESLWRNNDFSTGEDVILSNLRHKNLVYNALNEIDSALDALKLDLPVDLISINIKSLLDNLGEITGENVNDEVINGIFSRFCLGK